MSQLSGSTADFLVAQTDFAMGFSAQRDLFLCFPKEEMDFATDLDNLRALRLRMTGKRAKNRGGGEIHSRIHDQNPRRAPGETCCLDFLVVAMIERGPAKAPPHPGSAGNRGSSGRPRALKEPVSALHQKNPRAHKNRTGTTPTPPKKTQNTPPKKKKREILWAWVYPAGIRHFSRRP